MLALMPTGTFQELDRISYREAPFVDVLQRIVDAAQHAVVHPSDVSVVLFGEGGAHPVARTGKPALRLDQWQSEHGQGPCIAAAAANITVSVPDVVSDSRWPDWADQALGAGVYSCLSVGLGLRDGVAGSLTVYAAEPAAFDDETIMLIQTFACYAAMAMANAHLHPDGVTPTSLLRTELAARRATEQAVGIIMADRRCTAEHAAAVLATMSGEADRDVRAVAADIVAGVKAPRR
jgi:GAF domain-containing protein